MIVLDRTRGNEPEFKYIQFESTMQTMPVLINLLIKNDNHSFFQNQYIQKIQ